MFERAAAALTLGALCSDREEDEEALAAYSEGLTAKSCMSSGSHSPVRMFINIVRHAFVTSVT